MNGRLNKIELAARLENARQQTPVDSEWRHVHGAEVIVMNHALEERELVPLVIYRHFNDTLAFARPIEEFLERFSMTAAS